MVKGKRKPKKIDSTPVSSVLHMLGKADERDKLADKRGNSGEKKKSNCIHSNAGRSGLDCLDAGDGCSRKTEMGN